MECALKAGEYKYTFPRTEEQREADSDHGIFECDYDVLTISETNFKMNNHYYYEYEDSYYVMRDQNKRDVTVEGTVQVDTPGKWRCTIVKGTYENSTLHSHESGNDLTGGFTVQALPGNTAKITHVTVLDKGVHCGFATTKLNGTRELTLK